MPLHPCELLAALCPCELLTALSSSSLSLLLDLFNNRLFASFALSLYLFSRASILGGWFVCLYSFRVVVASLTIMPNPSSSKKMDPSVGGKVPSNSRFTAGLDQLDDHLSKALVSSRCRSSLSRSSRSQHLERSDGSHKSHWSRRSRRARSKRLSSNSSAIPVVHPDTKPAVIKVPDKTVIATAPSHDEHTVLADNSVLADDSSTIPLQWSISDGIKLRDCYDHHVVEMTFALASWSHVFGHQALLPQEFPISDCVTIRDFGRRACFTDDALMTILQVCLEIFIRQECLSVWPVLFLIHHHSCILVLLMPALRNGLD